MLLIISPEATSEEISQLTSRLEWMGLRVSHHRHDGRLGLCVGGGEETAFEYDQFTSLSIVEEVMPFKKPYRMGDRSVVTKRAAINVGKGVVIGDGTLAVMAGPCSIESQEQIYETARVVSEAGANILRGGAFKPRSSPYSFQGLGETGLRYLKEVGDHFGMATISEVMEPESVDLLCDYCDILQIGARNMQNYSLLKRVGKANKPVMLKRGLCATYQDFLLSAEYILEGGNEQVILCERGIRTYETYTRNTLDLAAVPILQELSHLPIIVDPSHGTGIRRMVAPLARAAVAVGTDGLMIEVHPDPDKALSDGAQTLYPEQFNDLMATLEPIANAVGTKMPLAATATTCSATL